MRFWPLLLLPLVIALGGCGDDNSSCAVLTGGGRYCLQPSTDLAPFDAQQKIEARFGERHETLIAEIEIDASGARLVALTPFGQTLLQIIYDNRQASAVTLPDRRISPAMIMALVQIALWPADSVRHGLETPYAVHDTPGQRRIVNGAELMLRVDYEGDAPPYRRIHLSVPAADLELDIETLQDTGGLP